MSVLSFFQYHIDAIQYSLDNLECTKAYQLVDLLFDCKGKIFFTGIGKNGHVAAKAASTFSSIGLPCFYINAVDSVHGDMGVINREDILIAISKSGNTEELIHFLHHVKYKNCKIVSIHSNPNNKSLDYSYMDIDLHVDQEADHLDIVPTVLLQFLLYFYNQLLVKFQQLRN